MDIKFETLTEEEKEKMAYSFAIQNAQRFVDATICMTELKDHRSFLKSMIEWLMPKLGSEGVSQYIADYCPNLNKSKFFS